MNFALQYSIQFISQALLLAGLWFWLGIPDAQIWQLGLSAAAALLYFVAQAQLNAYSLGRQRQWLWSLPLAPVILGAFTHWAASLLAVVLLLLVLLPSAAVGQFKVLVHLPYLLRSAALLALAVAAPKVLLEWIPKPDGLTMQALSFGLRAFAGYAISVFAWTSILDLARQAVAQQAPMTGLPEAPPDAQLIQ